MRTHTFVQLDTVTTVMNKLPHLTASQVIFLINRTKSTYQVNDHEASQYLISNRDTYFMFNNGLISPPSTLITNN